MVIGIGWGTSLAEVVKSLSYFPLSNVQVVQVIGAVGGRSDPHVDGPGVAVNFANKMNAEYHFLHAPLFLDSEEACNTLKVQSQIAKTLKEGTHSDMTLLGIGTVEVDPVFSSIFRSGFMTEEEILRAKANGAIANFCGSIMDGKGEILDIEINRRTMAVNLHELRENCGKIVGIAGGEKKSHAIASVLNGNWLDVLITDSAAVHSILE
jgi:DNA-binding transcriptional regulator LsrR (DeoR family)